MITIRGHTFDLMSGDSKTLLFSTKRNWSESSTVGIVWKNTMNTVKPVKITKVGNRKQA